MTKNKISNNYIFNLSYQILVIVIPIITMPYISRVLGPEAVGLQSYAYSIISYFLLLAALGTTTYAQREIATCQNDEYKRTKVFLEIFILRLCFSMISIVAYVGYTITFVKSAHLVLYLVQIIYLLSCAIDITWFFQGMEDFKTVVVRNTIVKVVNIIFIFVCVKSANDINLYVFGLAAFPMIANLSVWVFMKRYLVKIPLKELCPMAHFSGTFALFIPTIASQVYTVCDKTMLGVLTTTTVENGYYEQAEKIVRIALTIYSAYGTVVVPRIASLNAEKNYAEIHYIIQKSVKLMWFMTTAIFWGIISIADNVIPWYLGEAFSKVNVLMIIFSWLIIVVGLSNVVAVQFLVPMRKQNVFTVSVVVGAVVNLIMNFLLIPHFYSIGAAVASICAETLITAIQVVYAIKIMKFFSIKELFGSFPKYFIVATIMGVLLIGLKQFIDSTIVGSIIMVIFGCAIYIGILFAIKDELLISIITNVSGFLKKRRKA